MVDLIVKLHGSYSFWHHHHILCTRNRVMAQWFGNFLEIKWASFGSVIHGRPSWTPPVGFLSTLLSSVRLNEYILWAHYSGVKY